MSDTDSDKKSGGSSGKLILGVLAALGIAAGVLIAWRGGGRNAGDGSGGVTGGDAAEEALNLTRAALVATENMETAEGDQNWNALFARFPQDESVALNRAINRVLQVDTLAKQATNPSLEKDKQQAARDILADAIPSSRAAIDDLAAITKDPVTPIWLRTLVDMQEAALLRGSLTKSLRKGVFKRLAESINGDLGSDPRAMILGGPLIDVVDQLEDPIDGLPAGVLEEAAQSLAVLTKRHPDNLFFAIRAALLLIRAKDKQAAEFVRIGDELSAAIEPSIRQDTKPIGLTPAELVNQLVAAIESDDWRTAETKSVLWFNVLNKTEIVKTDRRRAGPHPLDRLSFDALRRLSTERINADPLEKGTAAFQFEKVNIGGSDLVASQAMDFDLDLDADLISVNPAGLLQIWQNDGKNVWTAAGELKLDSQPTGLLVADLFEADGSHAQRLKTEAKPNEKNDPAASSTTDLGAAGRHDTFASLIAFGDGVVQLIQVDGRQSTDQAARLSVVAGPTGLEDVSGVLAAIAGDLEADGDLDVVFATKTQGVRLFLNRGNRTFFEIPQDPKFGVETPVTSLAIADIDRDLDLDVVATLGDRIGILENLLHLQFRGRALEEVPAIAGLNSIAVHDVDGNVSWDLIAGGEGGSTIVYSHTAEAGVWTIDRVESSEQTCNEMMVADFDNDSWLELVSVAGQEARISRIGPWGFGTWEPNAVTAECRSLAVADFDQDGFMDLAGVQAGRAVSLLSQSESGHHLDVRFKGIADNASGRVNHYAIGSVLECRFGPHYRAHIVTSPVTHFGVANYDSAGSIRVVFPNGLTQSVRDPKIDSLVEEEQTLKGSCPYLYAWDGEKYVFQTDCLWAAPLGLQVARGVVAKDRPWEYLKIPGDQIQPRDGKYEFRITEELWEVAYFDKVALTVVDHPEGTEVWTNEKVGPGEIATPTIFAFTLDELRPVHAAIDTFGRDVTAKLSVNDRDFVQGFDQRLRQGLCDPHWIDLDFGDALSNAKELDGSIYLVLTGWIMPTDTSLNIQIDQNPELGPLEFPSVWVPADATDGWHKAIPFMGFPGGKTKTIVVDVTEAMNHDDPRFRIRTSAQIYWDRAAVAVQSKPAEFRSEDVNLLTAEVAFHGFSAKSPSNSTAPETYDYQVAQQEARWPPLRGRLTQFGDCLDLVREWDDAMVVISSGDEIRLSFSLPAMELPAGWRRDFVLHNVGWDKDADLNTLTGQSTEPLPYRDMPEYPPLGVEKSPPEERNSQHLQRMQTFRSFWYRGETPPPVRFQESSSVQ